MLTDYSITNKLCYFSWILVVSVLVRTVLSFLRAWEGDKKYFAYSTSVDGSAKKTIDEKKEAFSKLGCFERFKKIMCGFSKEEPYPDFFYNTILGIGELTVYPVLLSQGQYGVIGGWIGLKTISTWDAWKQNRLAINRYLIANAFQVIFSYCMLMQYVANCSYCCCK